MFAMPKKVTGLTNPHIENAYLKTTYHADFHESENVLVLETFNHDDDINMHDTAYNDVLADMNTIRREAARKVGRIDCVQIRSNAIH